MYAKQSTYRKIIISFFALLFVACGSSEDGNDNSSGEATTNRPEVPTMPAPSFNSVGQQSEITTTIETAAEEQAEEESGPNLALGERVYGNHCAECHGPNGEGGDAAALMGLSLEFAAFEDLLRTGGELGPEHLFGPQKVSPGGLEGLYGYLSQ